LVTYIPEYGDPLQTPTARDYTVRDFKAYLQTTSPSPSTSGL
jgi:hypothetical protein